MPQRCKHAEPFQEVGLLRLTAALVDALDGDDRAIPHYPSMCRRKGALAKHIDVREVLRRALHLFEIEPYARGPLRR